MSTNISSLISMLLFSNAAIGGENSYLNINAQPKFKLAWLEAFKLLSVAGEQGVVIGNDVYYAKKGKDGTPYINRMNKVVVELVISDEDKALLEEYENIIKAGNERRKEYRKTHSIQPQEVSNF